VGLARLLAYIIRFDPEPSAKPFEAVGRALAAAFVCVQYEQDLPGGAEQVGYKVLLLFGEDRAHQSGRILNASLVKAPHGQEAFYERAGKERVNR